MTKRGAVWVVVILGLTLGACGGDDGEGGGGGGDVDGSTSGADGSTSGMDGSTSGSDGSTSGGDGSTSGSDGGSVSVECRTVKCSGAGPFACADCVDNDDDGLVDAQDPDCLGACDNNETGFQLKIPGSDTPSCGRECYFDDDQGGGNDGCAWDSRCDPMSPDSNPDCAYAPDEPSAMCDPTLSTKCQTVCPPLVPNGCDCFGCCNIRERDDDPDNWVFIGTLDADTGEGSCDIDAALAGDTEACRPCTPHEADQCVNDCARCELCLGKSELPADCSDPPPEDGGTPDADGGTPDSDGGTYTDPDRCPGGEQPCGLPGDPLCAEGYYCVTGCCVFFG